MIALFWTLILLVSFFWNRGTLIDNNLKVVLNKSRAFFNQIVSARAWNAMHGGVYVFVSEKAIPNPYLLDSLRDINLPDGRMLTKINPAYMTRLISEVQDSMFDTKFHITSLKPLRPANMPDAWEAASLSAFERGVRETLQYQSADSVVEGSAKYRYMAPLITEGSCLQCHSVQGYKVGDIRGGISVSVPSRDFDSILQMQIWNMLIAHVFVYLVGIFGVVIFYYYSSKLYSAIEQKNRELDFINKSKDRFFSVIAHDLKSPFNTILGFSDVLASDYYKLDDKERIHMAEEIDTSAKRAFTLLENLLLWAKSQSNRVNLAPERINSAEVIRESITPYIRIAQKKGVVVNSEGLLDSFILIDRFSLRTIIANFFTNAVKFTPSGGVVRLWSVIDAGRLYIYISDSGVGIDRELLDQLVKQDEIVSRKGTDGEAGTGMGFILSREFISRNGGELSIDSVLGRGTTIKISFAMAEPF